MTQLNASMNPIGDEGAKHLATLLAESPQLPLARHLETTGETHQDVMIRIIFLGGFMMFHVIS